ncbi:MAG: geranylgeranyl reductase family protein [Methanomassiliicoccales archaeon]
MEERDVLVIGCGPAGSGAGLSASDGADTLMVDRKREIGTPVQCGEVIGRTLLEAAGLELPPSVTCGEQDHTRFIIDRRLEVINREPYWASVTVERKMLDKWLAARAARAGASVACDTRLTSLRSEEGRMVAGLSHRGSRREVAARALVAADGVHSTVSSLMGERLFDPMAVARGIEFEMVSGEEMPPCMQIFLEPEIGMGYGWIIPKGEGRANVGVGILAPFDRREEFLREWIGTHPLVSKYFSTEHILEVKRGEAPVPGFSGGVSRGQVLYAGDSAGQTLAFVGEGIMPSHMCGRMAGEVAAAACSEDDPSLLQGYDRAVGQRLGEELGMGAELKDLIQMTFMRPDLSMSEKVTACGLMMGECLQPEEMRMLTRSDLDRTLDPARLSEDLESTGARVELNRLD